MSIALNPELVLTTTIGKRAAKQSGVEAESISVKLGDLPVNVLERVLAYGFQRIVNDPIGGADTPQADKMKAARAMVDRMKRGEVGRVRGEAPDPFMVIVMRVVRKAVKRKNPDNYKKIMAEDKPDDTFKAILEKHRAANTPQYQAIMAEATLIRKQQEDLAKAKAERPIDLTMEDL